jgi:MFS family permease
MPAEPHRYTRLLLLTLCQGFAFTHNVTFIAINGLVGLALAPTAWLATLPVSGYVLGAALSTGLVARHQRRFGRQRAFMLGNVVAFVAALLCAWAVIQGSFWLLVAATLVAGYANANAALYRFAATEIVEPGLKERAISWVLAGGIIGGVVGPNLASQAKGWIDAAPFAGAYAALAGVALLSMAVMSRIAFPPLHGGGAAGAASAGRPLREIVRQPKFIVAVAACALGYGVMNLLMAATPIAMAQCQHPFSAAALVLEWHVLGMFVPSFFTGSLIKRFGTWPVMAAGVVLNLACIVVALMGVDLMHFLIALITLGVGWNFLFIGGTTLATETYRPEERTRAQAAIDFAVYATMTVTAFSSGALVTTGGWASMNLGSLVPMALLIVALGWLRLGAHSAPPATSGDPLAK